MKLGLLHQLLLGIWAMREGSAEPYYPLVMDILEGKTMVLSSSQEKDEDQNKEQAAPAAWQSMFEAGVTMTTQKGERLTMPQADAQLRHGERGLVVNMNITGPIAKDDGLCDIGMQTVASWIAQFDAEEAITGYTFNIDSPGGNGRAMFLLNAALARSPKPKVGITQFGECCSAAQGIMSQMDLCFAADETDLFGSIGTFATLRDMSKAMEARGITLHTIAATKSTQKNSIVLDAMKGPEHYDGFRKQYLDPFNERFLAMMKANRPGLKDENGVLEGRILFAPEAKSVGLIDSVGESLDSAVEAVRTLASKRKPNP